MSNKTILLVEDQIDFLAIQKLHLERHGYRVLAAEDGTAALNSARKHQPNLILMDYSMPRMDGLSAAQELKKYPETREIPIILLTAHSYGSVGRRAREAGCVAFVGKPCDPRRILEEVQKVIGPAD